MKRKFKHIQAIVFTACIFLLQHANAQSPNKMSYQAVVRNSSDQLVTDQGVGMQISILQGSATGTAVYVEKQTPTTNSNGLVSIEIGNGTVVSGDFATIDWISGPYFIKTETDPAGGTNYTITGTSQLLSVPFALYAKTAENVTNMPAEIDPTFTTSEAANVIATDITNLRNLSGFNTGDQDISGIAINTQAVQDTASQIRADIPDVSGLITSETDPAYTSSEATNITTTDITNLGNLSGINTGDQDISGIAINTQAVQDTASQIRADMPDVSGFITSETDPIYSAWDKNYIDLKNTPNIIDSITTVIDTTTRFFQTLVVNGNNLTISTGNTVTLPGGDASVPVYTTSEIIALTPIQGDAVFNRTENLYQIYNGSTWQSFSSNCWPEPTTANAGSDQTFTDGTVTTTLAANTPEAEHGTGAWTIISGTGGSFDNASSPTTTFNGVINNVYTLQWTITINCSSSTDDVVIEFVYNGPGSPLTDADGNTYNTIWIGNQLWMAENLKVTQEADGTPIPTVADDNLSGSSNDEWAAMGDNNTDKAYCYYMNSADSAAKYGALYTYAAAKNACPTGWHLPTDAEWTELTDYIIADGHSGTEGTALKTTSGWNGFGNGTDGYGFSVLPGGERNYNDGAFNGTYITGYLWSSTEGSSSMAYSRYLIYTLATVNRNFSWKSVGYSVRCIRD